MNNTHIGGDLGHDVGREDAGDAGEGVGDAGDGDGVARRDVVGVDEEGGEGEAREAHRHHQQRHDGRHVRAVQEAHGHHAHCWHQIGCKQQNTPLTVPIAVKRLYLTSSLL